MKIVFVVARVGNERNVISRLALVLADELRRQGDTVDVYSFSKKTLFNVFAYRKFKKYNCVLVANVGLQCVWASLLKRFGLVRKPFVALSFGSDIRATHNRLINVFNYLSKPAINLLIVINPDLERIAKVRGYKNVKYVHNWAGGLEP